MTATTPLPHYVDSTRLEHLVNYELVGKTALRLQRWRDQYKLKRRRPRPDSPLNPPLQCVVYMKEIMSRHYLEGRYAAGVRKVAWVTSGAPTEPLQALGFFLVYPENHAALCGVRRKAQSLAEQAEHAGWSRDICSYARTDIGAMLSGATPAGRLPRPDVLVCCTNICQTVLHWYRVLADYFECPLVLIDTPFLYEEAHDHDVAYVRRQIEDMIHVAEEIARKPLDEKRFKAVMHNAQRGVELWLEILNRSQHRPAPMTAFDGFIHMGPIVDMRGEAVAVEYYERMLRELDERIRSGVGAIKDERYRVLWDNLPIWFKIREFSKWLAEHGVNVVASTYTYAWGELAPMIDPENPLESMARMYLHPILNRSTGHKLESMRKMVGEFELDGVILHSDRSCKPYSLGQIDQRDQLSRKLGIPALLLEADHNDPRDYSDEQGANRLEAFIETMEARG